MKKICMKIIIITILAAIFSAFISCSPGSSDKVDESSESSERFDFEAVTEIIDGRKDIYVVLKVVTGEYWESIIDGLIDAGNRYGCNIYVGGSKNESDWKVQEDMLNEACEKGADAVIFAPSNSSKYEFAANTLHSKKIPLVLIDTIMTKGYYDTCYMTDNYQAGQLAAESLMSMLVEKGYKPDETVQVAIQVTTPDSQTLVDRIAGFNKYWYKNSPENWTIIDEIKFNQGDLDIAIQNGKDFLNEYPDLKAVVACNNSSSVGFATAIKESGRNDIVLSAFDYSEIVAEMIADENYTAATVVQKQYDMGYNGVRMALELIDGKTVDYKFTDTGVIVINERNYQQYEEGK